MKNLVTMTLDELKQLGAVPKDLQEIKDFNQSCITLREFQSLSFQEKSSNRKGVIIDNPKWVAISTSTRMTFSSDGIHVGKVTAKGRQFCLQELVDGRLATFKFIELFKKEGIKTMENNGLNAIDINALAGTIAAENAAPTTPMNQFSEGQGTPDTTTPGFNDVAQKYISANIANVKVSDVTDLALFNRRHGEYVGTVTQNDAIIKFSTKTKPRTDEAGRVIAVPNAPQDVKAKIEQGQRPTEKKWLETTTELTVKQAAPGKVLGSVIGIPVGGLVPFSEFRKEEIRFNDSETAVKYSIFDKDTTNTMISFYFGGKIREAGATHGASAGNLNLVASQAAKAATAEGGEVVYVRAKLQPDNRKKALLPTNYFPIKVYQTINPLGNLSQEEYDTLNLSSFIHLFQTSAAKPNSMSKIQTLGAEDARKVRRAEGEDGRIQSVFFTSNVGERQQLEVKAFHDNAVNLSSLEIPVKAKILKKDESGYTYRYVTYSSIDKQVNENPEYRKMTSLYSGKFENFLKAAHGAVTEESLKALTKKSDKGSKAASKTLTAEQTRALLFQDMNKGLNGIKIEGAKVRPSYQGIAELIEDIRS